MLLVKMQKAIDSAISLVEQHRKIHQGSLAHELVALGVLDDNTEYRLDSSQETEFWAKMSEITRGAIATGLVGIREEGTLFATTAYTRLS